jgi:hypothetical protein
MERVPAASPKIVSLTPFAPVEERLVRALDVHLLEASAETLRLRYVLDAPIAHLRIPPSRESRHADDLWRHTCFEAFMRVEESPAYYELNVSPSTEWALYSFTGTRKGMAPVAEVPAPEVRMQRSAQRLEMEVRLDLRSLSRLATLALAAVIEDENARLSYWALKHPSPQPDFHHPDAFVLELA